MTDLTPYALAEALRDQYVPERELRVGGMAVVWFTWDETNGRARSRTRVANERLERCACV